MASKINKLRKKLLYNNEFGNKFKTFTKTYCKIFVSLLDTTFRYHFSLYELRCEQIASGSNTD